MNPWTRREAHSLVDALERTGQISADTAAQAHALIDQGQPSRALVLVRQAVPYAAATS